MSQVFLTNWTIYFADEGTGNGDKQIKWTGTTGTTDINLWYSEIIHYFQIPANNVADATTPVKFLTPTEYEIGSFDQGDIEPWFIDSESIKHLTGGSLKTVKWKRDPYPGDGTGDIGIIKIPWTAGTDFVPGDIGRNIIQGSNSGTLLHYELGAGSTGTVWIRPDDNTATHDFDDSGTLEVTTAGGTGTVTIGTSAGTTGENIWSNTFTLGSIEDNTTIYITQSNTDITNTEDSGSGRWWGDGHLDVLILTTDTGTLTDRGLLTVYARQYSKKYGFFTTNAAAGGRIPVPLSTSDDLNNTSGYREFTGSSGSGTFDVDNGIYVGGTWATATARGVLTAVAGSVSAPELTYYLIGDLTDMSSTITEYVFSTGADGDATCTVGTPANTGPATAMTISFGLDDSTYDIDGDSTAEEYSIIISLGGILLATMNERLKYKTRRGNTTAIDGASLIEGQQYIGIDYRVDYTTGDLTGTIADGATVTQLLADGTTATSEVVAHDETDEYLMLRDTRGTLEVGTNANNLEIDGSNTIVMSNVSTTAVVIAPVQEHPFGNFAGGRFFGARGVVLDNVHANDSQNYELIDNEGNRITPPVTVPISVTVKDSGGNAVENAQVWVQKAVTDSDVGHPGNPFTSAAGNNQGDPDFVVTEAVPSDLRTSGLIMVQDISTGDDQSYRYASISGTTFTLESAETGTDDGAGTTTTISESGITAKDIIEGDTIRMTGAPNEWAIVLSNTGDVVTTTITSGGTSWASKAYGVHTLAETYISGTDTAFASLMNEETNASGVASENYTYSSDKSVVVRVRFTGGATDYLPFSSTQTISSTGLSLSVTLAEDNIKG